MAGSRGGACPATREHPRRLPLRILQIVARHMNFFHLAAMPKRFQRLAVEGQNNAFSVSGHHIERFLRFESLDIVRL